MGCCACSSDGMSMSSRVKAIRCKTPQHHDRTGDFGTGLAPGGREGTGPGWQAVGWNLVPAGPGGAVGYTVVGANFWGGFVL